MKLLHKLYHIKFHLNYFFFSFYLIFTKYNILFMIIQIDLVYGVWKRSIYFVGERFGSRDERRWRFLILNISHTPHLCHILSYFTNPYVTLLSMYICHISHFFILVPLTYYLPVSFKYCSIIIT